MQSQTPATSPQELPKRNGHFRVPSAAAREVDRRDHYLRCRAYLATLRLATSPEAAEPIPAADADVVSEFTAAIVAEATAAMALTVAAAPGMRQTATAAFLATRLVRLRLAADNAVSAARASDASALRQHVRRFEALTLALCTVQAAISSPPDQLAP